MKICYVAGPISRGDLADNCCRAFAAGLALLKGGVSPLVPHGSVFWGNRLVSTLPLTSDPEFPNVSTAFLAEALPHGTTHGMWVESCLAIIPRCDAVLRLPGESVGADQEVAEARRLGLPVLHGVEEVLAWARSEEMAGTLSGTS